MVIIILSPPHLSELSQDYDHVCIASLLLAHLGQGLNILFHSRLRSRLSEDLRGAILRQHMPILPRLPFEPPLPNPTIGPGSDMKSHQIKSGRATHWARRDIQMSRTEKNDAKQFLSLNCPAITLTAGVIVKEI